MKASISEVVFGQLDDGRTVKKFRLRNTSGAEAEFVNLGAAWMSFKLTSDAPSLVLGCETLEALLSQKAYLGATIGRYANRINHGRFNLNGKEIQLNVNLPPHHLHGGNSGFSSRIWDSHIELVDDITPTLTFTYLSQDGEEGFPGNVEVSVKITLTEDNSVRFEYDATPDQATIINLTNHTYFNLNGNRSGSLDDHEFQLQSREFLEADENAMPNGEVIDALGSPLDLTDWKSVTADLKTLSEGKLNRAGGFDHCFCYENDNQVKPMASARSLKNGHQLTCSSNLPGMQFYTGNFLGGTPINQKESYQRHGAFCFEPGFWTDSPNHSHFPNCVFDEHKAYSAIIEYSFK